jgi:hypothetical protein
VKPTHRPHRKRYSVGAASNGNGRTRDAYADVGRAMRLSHDRALAAGCTPAEMMVLASVHYWLATFSRLADRRSLTQIAAKAGLWSDEDAATDEDGRKWRWNRKRLTARLKPLVACGAIEYRPGGAGGPGSASYFALPTPQGGDVTAPPSDNGKGEHSAPLRGSTKSREGGALRAAQGGALSTAHARNAASTEYEQAVPRTGACDVVGPTARRTTAPASPSSPENEGREAKVTFEETRTPALWPLDFPGTTAPGVGDHIEFNGKTRTVKAVTWHRLTPPAPTRDDLAADLAEAVYTLATTDQEADWAKQVVDHCMTHVENVDQLEEITRRLTVSPAKPKMTMKVVKDVVPTIEHLTFRTSTQARA